MFNSAEAMSKRFLVSSDSGMKTVVPLLHCSINDRPTLISRIRHCQNALTKLINFLDSTFFYKFIILCCEIYLGFCVPKSIIIIRWLHATITLASFSRYSGYILQVWWTMPQSHMSDFLRIPHTKNYYKTCPFLAELLKIKIFHRFFETRCL